MRLVIDKSWHFRLTIVVVLAICGIVVIWLESGKWELWKPEPEPDTPTTFSKLEHYYQEDIQVGQIESNCGMRYACESLSVAVHLYTGDTNGELRPQLCVGGKYIIQKGVNGGGRGLNAAVLEPRHFQVVAVRNFDTYRQDSALEMDEWLEELLDGDILIILTTDEASARLNHTTRAILNSLGSGKVQDLSFRAQWYLITQKGGKGFSVYETITFPNKKSWGDGIEFRGCVPRHIPKQHITVDPSPRDLTARDHFCLDKTADIYMSFCSHSRFQLFSPALLTNRSLIGNVVYSLPIFLFAGNEFEVFVAALDSLIHQPGVLLTGITVFYSEHQKDVPGVTKLYSVKSVPVSGHLDWTEMVQLSREYTQRQQVPKLNMFIVIDRDSIPSPDFLFYLSQTSPNLQKDDTLLAVSAWSPNCYTHPGDVHSAYRVHGVPKYAALYRTDENNGGDIIIVPDVSRIQGPEACHPPSYYSENWIERPQDLKQDRYFHKLVILQQRSTHIPMERLLKPCQQELLSEGRSYVVYYKDDEELLLQILDCLGVLGTGFARYQSLVRVTAPSTASVLLINSNSSFYKARPIY